MFTGYSAFHDKGKTTAGFGATEDDNLSYICCKERTCCGQVSGGEDCSDAYLNITGSCSGDAHPSANCGKTFSVVDNSYCNHTVGDNLYCSASGLGCTTVDDCQPVPAACECVTQRSGLGICQ